MAVDFSGARAKLDWAEAQLNILERDIKAFIDSNVRPIERQPNTHPAIRGGKIYRNQVPVPLPIQTSTGMIIEAIRGSLDLMVVAMALENTGVEPTDAYFPFGKTKEDFFADKRVLRKIRHLSADDQGAIIALEPYYGGNHLLHALNCLCSKSKHRNLVKTSHKATGAGFRAKAGTKGGVVRRLVIYGPKEGSNVNTAFLDADPGVEFSIFSTVIFSEVGHALNKPVIETLRELLSLSRSIIDSFVH